MKREYVALSKTSDKKMMLKYDFFGVLQEVRFTGERWEEKQVGHAIRYLVPLTESSAIDALQVKDLPFEYREVPADVSFKAFWDLYGKKVGKLERAKKLWATIPEPERSEILLYLEKFNRQYIGNPYKPYPETFLSNKMWLAEKI